MLTHEVVGGAMIALGATIALVVVGWAIIEIREASRWSRSASLDPVKTKEDSFSSAITTSEALENHPQMIALRESLCKVVAECANALAKLKESQQELAEAQDRISTMEGGMKRLKRESAGWQWLCNQYAEDLRDEDGIKDAISKERYELRKKIADTVSDLDAALLTAGRLSSEKRAAESLVESLRAELAESQKTRQMMLKENETIHNLWSAESNRLMDELQKASVMNPRGVTSRVVDGRRVMKAECLQRLAERLANQGWCRYWLHWNHPRRDPWVMRIESIHTPGERPEKIYGMEEYGFEWDNVDKCYYIDRDIEADGIQRVSIGEVSPDLPSVPATVK